MIVNECVMIVTATMEIECVQHLELAVQRFIKKIRIKIPRNTRQDTRVANAGRQLFIKWWLKSQSVNYLQTISEYICTIFRQTLDKRLFVTIIFKIECVQYLKLTIRHYSKE